MVGDGGRSRDADLAGELVAGVLVDGPDGVLLAGVDAAFFVRLDILTITAAHRIIYLMF